MKPVIYTYQIPDPDRPIPPTERGVCGPSGVLVPFRPERLDAADVVGKRIEVYSYVIGTYGMGGAGFFGLRLGPDWLVIAIWAAGEWLLLDDRVIQDMMYERFGRERPWLYPDPEKPGFLAESELERALLGRTIKGVEVGEKSLRIDLDNGSTLRVDEGAGRRPPYAGSGQPRVFLADDDLRRAVFMCPTGEVWV